MRSCRENPGRLRLPRQFAGVESGRAGEPVDFGREIRPILSEHAILVTDLTTRQGKQTSVSIARDDAFRVREGIAAIVPAEALESELIRRVTFGDTDEVMPPPKFKKRLSWSQIDRTPTVGGRGGEMGGPLVPFAARERPAPLVRDRTGRGTRSTRSCSLAWNARDYTVARGRSSDPDPPRQPRPDRPAPDSRRGRCLRDRQRARAYERLVDRLLASPHSASDRPGRGSTWRVTPTPMVRERRSPLDLALSRLGDSRPSIRTCLSIGSPSCNSPAT